MQTYINNVNNDNEDNNNNKEEKGKEEFDCIFNDYFYI